MPLPPDRRVLLSIALLFMACSGGAELFLPGDGAPAAIELQRGGEQTGRVGEPLAEPLVFVVLDSRSRVVEGARVVFELSSAGPEADVVPDTATTNADGLAEVTLVLGTRIGPQSGEARVLMPEGIREPSTTFTIMAYAENANGLSAVSGEDQTAPAGSALPLPLVVQVTDAFGNPISGVPISWSAPEGGSVSEASNVTDGDGRASVIRTLGPTAGTQTTVATSEGLAGSPVTFTHTVTAGSVAGLSIVSGNEQTAEAGTELPADLVVRLVDASGNGVPDAAVTWVVGTGGGSVSPENTTTDEAGRASTRWTLGPNPGQNRVDAVVSGVGIVSFTATGISGAPPRLSIVTQPSGQATNGVRLERQPVVQVQDGRGGVVITAQLSGGGGELLGTRQQATGPNGTAAFTDLAIAGAEGSRRLVFTASGYAGATSSSIQVQSIPTTTTITSDSPDPSTSGQAVTVAFRVTASNLVPTGSVTVTVSDGVRTCTASLQGGAGSCQLTLTQTGQRTLRASYSGAPGFERSSGTASHVVNSATPENRPPHADYNWHCEGLTCDFVDRSTDPDGQVTGWSWNFGDGSGPVTQQNPTHTFPSGGTFTVALTATDDDGASHTATATVEVEAPPPPPPGSTTITITGDSPDPSDPGQAITVSFTVTSSSGTPTGPVTVTDQRGGSCTGSAPSGSCSYIPAGTGERTITATYDGNASFNGSSTSAQHTVNEPPNQAPTAAFTQNCNDLNCSFNSDASSDPDGQIAGWAWDFGDGSGSDQRNPNHSYTSAGTYNVTLTVTDNDGATDGETHQVTVTAPNQPPTVTFSQTCSGLTCQFSSAGTSDPNGDPLTYEWDFDDSGAGSSDPNPIYTFSAAGDYDVRLRVQDNRGGEGEEQHVVHVEVPNTAPTAVIGSISCTGMDCSYTDASTDPEGADTIRHWNWFFGDGATSDQRNPSHQYAVAGDYIVTLTVEDDRNASSNTAARNLTVTPPEVPAGARVAAATPRS